MWLIKIVSATTVLLIATNLVTSDELNTVADEESTTVDAFDAFQAFESAEETIDPQKEYARFKSAYDKLYHLPEHSKDIGYQQLGNDHENREIHENHENHVITTHRTAPNLDDENDVTLTTTSTPSHFETQATVENASDTHTQHTLDHGHNKQANGPSSDYLVSRLSDAIESSADNEFADETVGVEPSKLEKNVQRIVPVYFVQNDAGDSSHKDNDTIDYVNDDGNEHEENSSQPITMPYDTTIASVPLIVSHVHTSAAPSVAVPTTTTTTTKSTFTTAASIVVPPPAPPTAAATVPSHIDFV